MYGESLNYCLIIPKCLWEPDLLCVAVLKAQDLILQLRQLTSSTLLHQVSWAGILCLWNILVSFCEDRRSSVLHSLCQQTHSSDPALTHPGPGHSQKSLQSRVEDKREQGGGHRVPVALSPHHWCAREAQSCHTRGRARGNPSPSHRGVLGASYGPEPPSPCCDPSGNPGTATVPEQAGAEQSRRDSLSRICPLQQLCWDFPGTQENRSVPGTLSWVNPSSAA